jgi:hypothetical protein
MPTNTTLVPGAPLYAITSASAANRGYLTPNGSYSVGGASVTSIVGTFVNFEDTMSLVTTQSWMTSIAVSATPPTRTPTMAVFYFNPPSA